MKEEEIKIDVMTKFTLTTLVKWLNENFTKGSHNKKFTTSDVQGYLRRGYLPTYIKPGYQIRIETALDLPGAKLYKLKEVKLHKR